MANQGIYGDFASNVKWGAGQIGYDSSSPDQIVIDPTRDDTYQPNLRAIVCKTAVTLRYKTLAGRTVEFEFPAGVYPVSIVKTYGPGSSYSSGDILGLF